MTRSVADAQSVYAGGFALSAESREIGDASALYGYQAADSRQYAALTGSLTLIDKSYALAEAASLSMAAAFAAATATQSP